MVNHIFNKLFLLREIFTLRSFGNNNDKLHSQWNSLMRNNLLNNKKKFWHTLQDETPKILRIFRNSQFSEFTSVSFSVRSFIFISISILISGPHPFVTKIFIFSFKSHKSNLTLFHDKSWPNVFFQKIGPISWNRNNNKGEKLYIM